MMSEHSYERALSFVLSAPDEQRVRLTYEASTSGTEQVVEGETSGSAHMNEYTVVDVGDGLSYRVWNGRGIRGRDTGDVMKEKGTTSRMVGVFVRAEVLDDE